MITHDAILSRLAELRATAEAAADFSTNIGVIREPGWRRNPRYSREVIGASGVGAGLQVAECFSDAHAEQAATWDPAHSLRWIGWAEDVAKRHKPVPDGCDWCVGDPGDNDPWPCADIDGLAGALGLEET